MAIRHNNRGTLVIERKFGTVKLRRASGTNNADTFAEILDTLDSLVKTNREDLIERLTKKGEITPLELHQAIRAGKVFPVIVPNEHGPASGEALTTPLLHDAIEPFLSYMERVNSSPRYLKDLRFCLNKITKAADEHGLTKTKDLPQLFRQILAPHAEAMGTPDAFRVMRAAALALAKWSGTVAPAKQRLPELYRAMLDIPQIKRKTRKREHKPYSPFDAWGWRAMLNLQAEKDGFGPVGDVFWALCITGMRPSEYWGLVWSVGKHHLQIDGKKTARSTRKIPRLEPDYALPSPTKNLKRGKRSGREECPTRNYAYFGRYLREFQAERTNEGRTVYDTRRTFAHWMELAGIPATRRRHYLGHAPGHLTEQYEDKRPTPEEIETDGVKLRRYISEAISGRADQLETQTGPLTPIAPAPIRKP